MKKSTRFKRFVKDIVAHTPFVKMILLMIALWLFFSAGLYLAEMETVGATITTYGSALYWGVAAFSTAGIADTPVSGIAKLVGGIWIVVGSVIFFGTIVATITTYFMRPLQRPVRQIVNTIEYNLERLDDLSIEELDVLKNTTDSLILHVEHLKRRHASAAG